MFLGCFTKTIWSTAATGKADNLDEKALCKYVHMKPHLWPHIRYAKLVEVRATSLSALHEMPLSHTKSLQAKHNAN